MPKINRYWNSDPDSLVEYKRPETYDLCKSCECINQLLWKEKRLKYTLWLTRALRARDVQLSLRSPRNKVACRKWGNVKRKCLKKAEEYK